MIAEDGECGKRVTLINESECVEVANSGTADFGRKV